MLRLARRLSRLPPPPPPPPPAGGGATSSVAAAATAKSTKPRAIDTGDAAAHEFIVAHIVAAAAKGGNCVTVPALRTALGRRSDAGVLKLLSIFGPDEFVVDPIRSTVRLGPVAAASARPPSDDDALFASVVAPRLRLDVVNVAALERLLQWQTVRPGVKFGHFLYRHAPQSRFAEAPPPPPPQVPPAVSAPQPVPSVLAREPPTFVAPKPAFVWTLASLLEEAQKDVAMLCDAATAAAGGDEAARAGAEAAATATAEDLLKLLSNALVAVFDVLLPSVGMSTARLDARATGRARWPGDGTVGCASSVVQFFDGVFFDQFDEGLLREFTGRVTPRLVVSRVVCPFLPANGTPVPLRAVAAALAWPQRFSRVLGGVSLLAALQSCGRGLVEYDGASATVRLVTAGDVADVLRRNAAAGDEDAALAALIAEQRRRVAEAAAAQPLLLDDETALRLQRRFPLHVRWVNTDGGGGDGWVVNAASDPVPACALRFAELYLAPALAAGEVGKDEPLLQWWRSALSVPELDALCDQPPGAVSLSGVLERCREAGWQPPSPLCGEAALWALAEL